MKHWLTAALICFCSSVAVAATETTDLKLQVMSFKAVSVSTITPTALFTATLQGTTTDFYDILRNRKYIEIQNVDPSTTTYAVCTLDVSSNTRVADMAGNQIEYKTAPSTTTKTGYHIPPFGLNADKSWKPSIAESNGSGLLLVPWCQCYYAGASKGASACTLSITQGADY